MLYFCLGSIKTYSIRYKWSAQNFCPIFACKFQINVYKTADELNESAVSFSYSRWCIEKQKYSVVGLLKAALRNFVFNLLVTGKKVKQNVLYVVF